MTGHPADRRAYRPLEVVRLTGLSRGAVYRAIAAGLIRAVRVGEAILIPAEELERLLREGTGPKGAA